MKIGINGAGIAGPTLAWWLRKYGHEPVLFEKAPELRTGGYVVDFWGVGYDIAEKMGLLPELQNMGYRMQALEMVNSRGETAAKMGIESFRALTSDRYLSIARGDLAASIFGACTGIETRFGTSIAGLTEEPGRIFCTAQQWQTGGVRPGCRGGRTPFGCPRADLWRGRGVRMLHGLSGGCVFREGISAARRTQLHCLHRAGPTDRAHCSAERRNSLSVHFGGRTFQSLLQHLPARKKKKERRFSSSFQTWAGKRRRS